MVNYLLVYEVCVKLFNALQPWCHEKTIQVNSICIPVSPAGSLQDVSPPTTPSSRPNSYGDHSSHTPSPNVMSALSPPVSHQHGVPSPQIHFPQTSPQFPPRHGGSSAALNVFPQVQLSSSPRVPQQYTLTQQQYGTTQQGPKQQINDYRQFSRTNSSMSPLPQVAQQGNGGSLSQTGQVVSPQPVVYKTNASPQPVLHPLQQATLVLQQRKMSEVCLLTFFFLMHFFQIGRAHV